MVTPEIFVILSILFIYPNPPLWFGYAVAVVGDAECDWVSLTKMLETLNGFSQGYRFAIMFKIFHYYNRYTPSDFATIQRALMDKQLVETYKRDYNLRALSLDASNKTIQISARSKTGTASVDGLSE